MSFVEGDNQQSGYLAASTGDKTYFYFHESDPQQLTWRKEDARLRKKGVATKHRPPKPESGPVPVLQRAADPIEAVPECHVIAQGNREVANLVTGRTPGWKT